MPRTEGVDAPLILLDGGTTNTRGWLVHGGDLVASELLPLGVRDVARSGSRDGFYAALRELIDSLSRRAADAGAPAPSLVVAAGMIGTDLGLGEVPHVEAPAGVDEIAAGARRIHQPDVTSLEILLIPGVRTGGAVTTPETIGRADVMRGEETLVIGLLEDGRLRPGEAVLNLGSHWKLILTDAEGRIRFSVTSLTGELIHAAQTQTVLAASVPPHPPRRIDPDWFDLGMEEAERAGLGRALFCVRLLEQRCEGDAEQRLSYLVGACAGADLIPLIGGEAARPDGRLVICGAPATADAVGSVFRRRGFQAEIASPDEVAAGMRRGIQAIAARIPNP